MNSTYAPQMEAAEQAARMAGDCIMSLLGQTAVREKGPQDLVTEADIAAQAIIEKHLQLSFPDYDFLGEESDRESAGLKGEWLWIVDPIDGTANYVHGLPNFAVSIALARHGEVVVGVVYDPCADVCYCASADSEPVRNGQPIAASNCEALSNALVAASFPPNVQKTSIEVSQFLEVLVRAQSLRRLGSAALNLCYVADGKIDGYWASSVKSWDVAAGQLIAVRAGAFITDVDGSPFSVAKGSLTVAANKTLHSELQNALLLATPECS